MLDGLATNAHFVRIGVEPSLNFLKNGLVLPSGDPALRARSAFGFQRTGLTVRSPVAAQIFAVFFSRISICQLFTGRTAINIVLRDIDEILFVKPAVGFAFDVAGFGKQ